MAAISRLKVGIVVAMAAELKHLLARFPVVSERQIDPWQFLTLAGPERLEVVGVRSGMGMVNAAAATERLVSETGPDAVLNFGCTGAHRRDIQPGDVIIGDRYVHHSALRILSDGTEEYAGFGYEVGGEKMNQSNLPADQKLLERAIAAGNGAIIPAWEPDDDAPRAPIVYVGAVATADIWTQQIERLDALHSRHATLCEDMEAAAIAQVCALHRVPFLSIKDISNNEFDRATDLKGFADFRWEEVGRRAAAVTAQMLLEF